MTAGGHFAGAIVRVSQPAHLQDLQPEVTKKGKLKKPVPDIEILKHKTFHRYTSSYCFLLAECILSFNSLQLVESKKVLSRSTIMLKAKRSARELCCVDMGNRH